MVALWMSLGGGNEASADFQEAYALAVIRQAVNVMPAEIKAKLTPIEKEILAGAKAVNSPKELFYFVDAKTGAGLDAFVKQFRLVEAGDKSSYKALAPSLGGVAGTVIALCQPYHTEKSAFEGESHAAFEAELGASAASLSSRENLRKVDKPGDFGAQIAGHANLLLIKLSTLEGKDTSSVKAAVFSLAVNSLADCWTTLLPLGEKTEEAVEKPPFEGNYIGNKRSMKFHLPTCRYMPAPQNQIMFKTREEAISQKYVPCKVCKP